MGEGVSLLHTRTVITLFLIATNAVWACPGGAAVGGVSVCFRAEVKILIEDHFRSPRHPHLLTQVPISDED